MPPLFSYQSCSLLNMQIQHPLYNGILWTFFEDCWEAQPFDLREPQVCWHWKHIHYARRMVRNVLFPILPFYLHIRVVCLVFFLSRWIFYTWEQYTWYYWCSYNSWTWNCWWLEAQSMLCVAYLINISKLMLQLDRCCDNFSFFCFSISTSNWAAMIRISSM